MERNDIGTTSSIEAARDVEERMQPPTVLQRDSGNPTFVDGGGLIAPRFGFINTEGADAPASQL